MEFEQDTETNNRLVPLFGEELRRRGYAVGENLRLVLSFDTDVGSRSVKAPRSDSRSNGNGPVPIRDSTGPRLTFPCCRAAPAHPGSGSSSARECSSAGGKVLWEGRLVAVLLAVDRNKAFRAMVPVLMTYLDETTNGTGETGN